MSSPKKGTHMKTKTNKNTMTTTILKEALVSVWAKAHAFEEAFNEHDEGDDYQFLDELAREFVNEWELIADDLAPLFDPKTTVEEAKKIGSDYLMLALYCYGWWQEADGMLDAHDED